MATKQQAAKFYCENCGAEVPANARVCKTCGRFFSAVRCPNCGATGGVSMFKNGCPVCGYAMKSGELYGADAEPQIISHAEKIDKKAARIFSGKKYVYDKKNRHRKNTGDGTLPLWIYLVTAGVLALVIAAAFGIFKR